MKKYNRILVLALCITLFISLCIACSNKGAKASSGKTTQEVTGANKTSEGQEPLTLPIVKEPLTLTYFLPLDVKAAALIKSYNEMSAYQEAEKRTGIHIEFQHPPAGQETEQFNLMVASASLTDIVGWDWFRVSGGPAKVLEDGSIIKLNDLIEKYAPNLKKLLNNNPEARKAVMLDDGTFFMFPNLILEPGKQPTDGFQIRKDWLDREGLQIPATIDEWYTALKAIKEKDVNGNGKPNDEIPFLSKKSADFKYFSGAWGIDAVNGFYQINGKVKYTPLEPQYKDYIRTMAKWYKEGLIDPEYASVDTKNFDAKVTGNRGGAYYGLLSGNLGTYISFMKPKDKNFNLRAAPYPTGSAGKPFTNNIRAVRYVEGGGTAVSSKNKHQKEAIKWLDYAYSEEGSLLFNWGIEGKSYVIENGKPKFTDIVVKDPKGLPVSQAIVRYSAASVATPRLFDLDAKAIIRSSWPEQSEAMEVWAKADTSLLLPDITPTVEESNRLARIMGEINTYNDEMFNKFIMGQESIENFDKYVSTLKGMGIDEALQIQQAALDRYNSRK